MANRASRRAALSTNYEIAFKATFLHVLDTVAEEVGTSRARIEEIRHTGQATMDEYKKIADCLIIMTGLVLNEGEKK